MSSAEVVAALSNGETDIPGIARRVRATPRSLDGVVTVGERDTARWSLTGASRQGPG
jgi:hypothetical protein